MICNLNLRALCVLALVVAASTLTLRVSAQVTGGTISGTVTDSGGKVAERPYLDHQLCHGGKSRSYHQRRRVLLRAQICCPERTR